MSRVIVHKRAAKYLQKLPQDYQTQVKNALKTLEDNPLTYPGLKQMVGQWAGYYRLRVGHIRVIFWFDPTQDTVYIDHIGPRGDVYK